VRTDLQDMPASGGKLSGGAQVGASRGQRKGSAGLQGEAGGVDAGMRGRAAAGNSTGRDIPSNDGGAAPAKALSAREEEEQVRQKRIKERPAAPRPLPPPPSLPY